MISLTLHFSPEASSNRRYSSAGLTYIYGTKIKYVLAYKIETPEVYSTIHKPPVIAIDTLRH
jgi:hypothetical protein